MMAATREQEYYLYKSLLEPSREWAFNFMLLITRMRQWAEADEYARVVSNTSQDVLVGSVAEGLSLNAMTKGGIDGPTTSDFDMMRIHPGGVIMTYDDWTLNHVDRDNLRVLGFSVTSDTHPGYLRIALVNRPMQEGYMVRKDSIMYLTGGTMFPETDLPEHTSSRRHEPAFEYTTLYPEDVIVHDLVTALQCISWPAKSWPSRSRPAGWPSQELIAKIVADGCHVVKKAHPKASESEAEIEFRYSFSFAELELCKTLSIQQRDCMKLFKLLVIATSNKNSCKDLGLTSYHLKTVFLWLCERMPASEWAEDNFGRCLLALLDQLLDFLKKANVPNYFMPENNMVDHIAASDMQSLIGFVQNIRDNPIDHLFLSGCFSSPKFFGICPREMFKPILEVLTISCQNIDQLCLAMYACSHVLQNAARSVCKLKDGWLKALIFMEVQSRLLQSLGFRMSPSLLLTILFLDRFKSLIFPSSLKLLCRPLGLNDDRRFWVFMQISNFLYALGHDKAALDVLQKVDTLLAGDQDSTTAQARRAEVDRAFRSTFKGLGIKEEAEKYSVKCARHFSREYGQRTVYPKLSTW